MRFPPELILAATLLMVACAAYAQDAPRLAPTRVRLPNGLTVIALEDHTVPSVALNIVYRVGSRNERPGITGISHLFEHMMFNGSAKFPPGTFDRLLEAGGGYSNAGTSTDDTSYIEEFSSATIDTALRLEADRMRALRIDRANLEQERGIVMEERRVVVDNSVEGSMTELLWNCAFLAHSYRWDTIGFMKDIAAIRLDDARNYFHVYYNPSNAVLAVVGDFQTADLIARVKRYFGAIPKQPAPPRVGNAEPEQHGERRAILEKAAELPAVTGGYKIGTFLDPDDPALDALATILALGDSSRLYRALVRDQRIATSVTVANESRIDPGLFTFAAQAAPGHTAAECEAAIYAELDRMAREGPTEHEVQKAKNGLRAAFIHRFTTNIGRAELLTEYEVGNGSWRRYRDYLPLREKLTAAAIRDVARKYLVEPRRTVVTLRPLAAANETPGGAQ